MSFPPLAQGAELMQLGRKDVEYLDRILLNAEGRLKPYPAEFYTLFKPNHVRAWANLNARYCLPTEELIAWLRLEIAGKKALEICAGCGDLGYRLQIPMTDSYQQVTEPYTMMFLAANGQKPTTPPPDVEKEDAEQAVRRRKPQVVIAAWVTEKWMGDPNRNGNMFGPREDYILERCEKYIVIGNEAVHGNKRLLKQPHETLRFPWLVSRAKDQSKNCIYVWHNQKRR